MNRFVKKSLAAAACLGLALSLAACTTSKIEDPGAVFSVDGKPVSYDEFRYYFLNLKNQMASASSSSGGSDADTLASVLTEVENYLISSRVIDRWVAGMDIAMSDTDKEDLNTYVASMRTQMGDDMFQQTLDGNFMTEEVFRDQQTRTFLQSKGLDQWLRDHYGDAIRSYVSENMDEVLKAIGTPVQHVLIQFESTEEGADHSAERAKAEEVLQKAKAGEDFTALIRDYNEDPGQTETGFYPVIGDGTYVEEFEKAAMGLDKEGDISDIVETSYGYHILKRVALTQEYIDANLASVASQELIDAANKELQEELDALEAEIKVEKGDMYDKLTLTILDGTIPADDSSSSGSSSSSAPGSSSSSSTASSSGSSSSAAG